MFVPLLPALKNVELVKLLKKRLHAFEISRIYTYMFFVVGAYVPSTLKVDKRVNGINKINVSVPRAHVPRVRLFS
jgi:hypothetical protein